MDNQHQGICVIKVKDKYKVFGLNEISSKDFSEFKDAKNYALNISNQTKLKYGVQESICAQPLDYEK